MLPLVVTVENVDGNIRRYAFADSPISIGRSPFAELQLSEAFVSRWEGTLRFDAREITYFSLGSTNPTFVDGREVIGGEDLVLGPQTVLTLGELRLRFSREHVAEADIRRRGKQKPVQDGQDTALKTAFLDAPQSARRSTPPPADRDSAGGLRASQAPAAFPSASSVDRPSAPYEAVARGDVRVLGRVTVAGLGATPGADTRQYSQHSGGELSPSSQPVTSGPASSHPGELRAAPASRPPVSGHTPRRVSLADLNASYREAWRELLQQFRAELERATGAERAELADQIQRRYPQAAQESEFRDLLKHFGLPARRAEVLEVRAWLTDIARGVLPDRMNLDTGLTLDRILALLETLTQSLAEINDAQETVRQRWLGRQARRSVLHSENGRAILAYLLNPQANWNERLVELEQTIREVVTHELALFKATMEGAKLLVDSLSPQAIAQAEGIDLGSVEEGGRPSGLWDRLRPKDAPEARLWRRFLSTHETLMDSNRYQRVFLGRVFARTYLAAMGKKESLEKLP